MNSPTINYKESRISQNGKFGFPFLHERSENEPISALMNIPPSTLHFSTIHSKSRFVNRHEQKVLTFVSNCECCGSDRIVPTTVEINEFVG